jgi:anti-sigma regulatory factor (Ser/Thr protein kinase)
VRVCCEPVLRAGAPFQPSPLAVSRHVDLDPVPASVGIARQFVRSVLAEIVEDGQDIATLLTSELVTNAILHARTPVQLGIMLDTERALVCVADRLSEGAVLTPRSQSADRPGGRGLALVSDLAVDWGTTTYTGGKTVWFVLAVRRDEALTPG